MTEFIASIHTYPQAIVASVLILTPGACAYAFIKGMWS